MTEIQGLCDPRYAAVRDAFAGVDPFNKRIDRNSEDNLATVDK